MGWPRRGGADVRVLVLGHREVHELLPMAACVDLMEETLKAVSAGHAVQPLRTRMALPSRLGRLGLMPAYLDSIPVLGAKVISVFHGNTDTPYESHQGPVVLFEPEHGQLLAMVDAATITAVRTAAVSGAATRHLARAGAVDLAIVGSGTQALLHVAAVLAVREVSRLRLWSRREEHARRLAERVRTQHGLVAEVVAGVEQAVAGADVVCTTTSASEPILRGEWLSLGAHVNAVGASSRGYREVDAGTVARSRVFVDRRESAEQEADEIRIPLSLGEIGPEHVVGELGELFSGRVAGRRTTEEITLFKSLGLAVEDLAAAHEVYRRARERGLGAEVEFSGERTS